MIGLIKKNENNANEVVWVNDDEILAVRSVRVVNRKEVVITTVYGDLNYPQTFEEVCLVLASSNSNLVNVDLGVAVNLNKVAEKDKSERTVRLEGVDNIFNVSVMGWKRHFES
jgi:hypothetical protein